MSREDITYPKVDPLQSVFTSLFFMGFVDKVLPNLDAKAHYMTFDERGMLTAAPRGSITTKFDGTDFDLLNFLNKFGAFLGDVTCNLSTGIGLAEDMGPLIANLDPVNAELGNSIYRLMQHRTDSKFYFPTVALTDALNNTDLKWVDLKAFADLPALIAVRLHGFKCKVNGEIHNCDDFMLVRDDTPATRRKALLDHSVPTEFHDTALVFHWLTQSRDELHLGLQSQTFGTFVLHQDMKLDDIITLIDAWSQREVARVRQEAVGNGLLERVEEARHDSDTNLHQDPDDARLVSQHADYLTNTLTQLSWDEQQREWYKDILRFVFKFVLLLSAEGAKVKALLPPGVKDKANLSRKARKVHEGLWKAWGRRYLVDVPPEDPESALHHRSPVRHLVPGFFRRQAYGPQNSLRKIIWIHPFWRGSNSLVKED